jgi:hypothetical protein
VGLILKKLLLLPAMISKPVSVVENSSTDTPLLTIAHGSTDKSIQYGISGRDKDFFNLKGNVVSFKNSPDYERKPSYSLILENSCDGTLGSEFVIIDDFKMSTGGGKSHGSSSSKIFSI